MLRQIILAVVAISLPAHAQISNDLHVVRPGSPSQKPKILDFTKPSGHESESMRIPGMMVGGVLHGPEAGRIHRYPLPLQITIRSIKPSKIRLLERPIVEIALKNTGNSPFQLPISRDQMATHHPGNMGRRSFGVQLYLIPAGHPMPEMLIVLVLEGSASKQESLLPLIAANLRGAARLVSERPGSFTVQAACYEYLLEDARYWVADRSEEILSKNVVRVEISR